MEATFSIKSGVYSKIVRCSNMRFQWPEISTPSTTACSFSTIFALIGPAGIIMVSFSLLIQQDYSTTGVSSFFLGNPNNLRAIFGRDGSNSLKSRLKRQLVEPYI